MSLPWGTDPDKWVIKKDRRTGKWLLWSPMNSVPVEYSKWAWARRDMKICMKKRSRGAVEWQHPWGWMPE